MLNAGFDWKKVTVEPSNTEHVDLREVLKTGSFIVDGILNQTWCDDKDAYISGATKKVRGKVVPNEPGPAANEKAWRHAIAVIDGVVHEWTGEGVSKFSIEWLWLGDNGVTPDSKKGYMRRILKVYRVSPKA